MNTHAFSIPGLGRQRIFVTPGSVSWSKEACNEFHKLLAVTAAAGKRMLTGLPQLMLFLLLLPVAVQAQFTYVTNNGTITITGYSGPGGDVTIPGMIDGLPVTSIASWAFCCGSPLTSVAIPNTVTNIDIYAFTGNGSLTAILVDASNPAYSSAAGVLFDKNQTTLLTYPDGKNGAYTIPDTVTSIMDWAFYGCQGLSSITISDSVISIGTRAFDSCSGLTNITILSGLTNIGDSAFARCDNLLAITVDPNNSAFVSLDGVLFNKNRTIVIKYPGTRAGNYVIPDGVTSIASWAFTSCTNLTVIALPAGVTNVGVNAFAYCTSLTSLKLSDGLTSIGGGAFAGCPITNVMIPVGVTDIGDHAFADCGSLTSIVIPNGVTNLGDFAFARCGITNVTIPGSVRNLGYVFQRCTNLTSVTIGDGVTSIGNFAFQNVDGTFQSSNLRSVRIPGTVTNIGHQVFDSCYKLTNAPIPNGVVTIGYYAFAATALTSITIPDSVVLIRSSAFSSCASVTNITIGRGVVSIGNAAFGDAISLRRINFLGNAPVLETDGPDYPSYAFWNDNNATVYYLPGTSGWTNLFGGRPTARWLLPTPTILTFPPYFGVQTNQFGFRVSWATNRTTVVEACTDLASPNWTSLATNIMNPFPGLNPGWFYFSDPEWTNYPNRIYRVRKL